MDHYTIAQRLQEILDAGMHGSLMWASRDERELAMGVHRPENDEFWPVGKRVDVIGIPNINVAVPENTLLTIRSTVDPEQISAAYIKRFTTMPTVTQAAREEINMSSFVDYRAAIAQATGPDEFQAAFETYAQRPVHEADEPTLFHALRIMRAGFQTDPRVAVSRKEALDMYGVICDAIQALNDGEPDNAVRILEAAHEEPAAYRARQRDLDEFDSNELLEYVMDGYADEIGERLTENGWIDANDDDEIDRIARREGYLHPDDDDFYETLRTRFDHFHIDDLDQIAEDQGYYHWESDGLWDRIYDAGYIQEDDLYERGYRSVDDLEDDGWVRPENAVFALSDAETVAANIKQMSTDDFIALPDELLEDMLKLLKEIEDYQQQEAAA